MGENRMNIDTFYPVGSIYMCTDSAFNPNEYGPFSGSVWSALNDSAANISTTGTASGYVGANSVSLTTAMMQSHNHTGSLVVAKPGTATGTYGNTTMTSRWNWIRVASTKVYGYGTTTLASTGGGEAHNNMQPYRQVYKWYRVE